MKTFRFYTGGLSYTDVNATSKKKAIEYFKREYDEHLTMSGRLRSKPTCVTPSLDGWRHGIKRDYQR